jgi:hypothetical protein
MVKRNMGNAVKRGTVDGAAALGVDRATPKTIDVDHMLNAECGLAESLPSARSRFLNPNWSAQPTKAGGGSAV